MASCKCGCGEPVKGSRKFVNKIHQLNWMNNGCAREMNSLLPNEVRVRGGITAGRQAAESGRLRAAGLIGGERSRQMAEQWRADNRDEKR